MALRDGDSANSVQLAEMEVYGRGLLLKADVAFNPNGASPGAETPAESIDGDLGTKWLDFNRGSLVLDFGKSVSADSYRWATANDAWERDPFSWRFEGSVDNKTWTLLDERLNYATPLDRFTFLPLLDFTALPQRPEIRAFTVQSGNIVSDEAIAVTAGAAVTLRWEVTNATEVRIDPGAGPVALAGEQTAVVSETTIYILVATNAQGESSAAVSVLVDPTTQAVWINEFMASNPAGANAFVDEDGDAADWIEIYNPNPFDVELAGYSLTTETSLADGWTFPNPTVVGPDSYLVIFASGKNRVSAGQPLHSDFKLNAGGEYLALVDAQGRVVHEFPPAYTAQYPGISYGLTISGNPPAFDYFTVPTPGAANEGTAGLPITESVSFSPPSRAFTGSVTVLLAGDVAGAELRYTIDGAVPTDQSPRYSGPLSLTGSTQVRARLFKAGWGPGPVVSATYVKLSPDAAAFTSNLPVFILDNYGRGSVPTSEPLQENIFLAFETNATGRASLLDTPATIHRSGISRRGSSTLHEPKGNYRLEFWDESNEDEDVSLLGLPEDPDWILTAPYRFDRSLIRVPFIHQLSLNIGKYAPRSLMVELFLNADNNEVSLTDYAGVYILQERISRGNERVDVERLDSNEVELPDVTGGYILSIDRSDSPDESFRTRRGTPTLPPQGTPRPWFNFIYPKAEVLAPEQRDYIQGYLDLLEDALFSPQFTNSASGYRSFLDVDAFIDHHVLIVLSKDPDALRLSTYLHKPRLGKLRMGPIWDFDRSMGGDSDGRADEPVGWDPLPENAGFFTYDWWGRLFEDPDFAQRWIDRWQVMRQGPMSDTAMSALVGSLAAKLDEAHVRNFQRWPEVSPNGGQFSDQSGWPGEVEHLIGWLARRAAWIDSHFPPPPTFAPASGQVSPGTAVALSGASSVYYTTDGSDPRLPGGGISSDAQRFTTPAQPVQIQTSTTLAARAFDGTQWSSIVRANYVTGVPASSSNLVMSEFHYHPAGPSVSEAAVFDTEDFEFIELLNAGATSIDLHGVALSEGIRFQFDSGRASVLELAPGARLILVNNLLAFQTRYMNQLDGVQLAGEYEGDLSNDSDRLRLTAVDGSVIHDFNYGDQLPWPAAADGEGFSLVLSNPTQQPTPDHSDPSQWRSSLSIGGSPGLREGSTFVGDRDADLDQNGQPDFLDYALGYSIDPQAALPLRITMEALDVNGLSGTYGILTFTENPMAADATISLEVSTDLQTWTEGKGSFVRLNDGQSNTLTLVALRSTNPLNAEAWRFVRLVAQ